MINFALTRNPYLTINRNVSRKFTRFENYLETTKPFYILLANISNCRVENYLETTIPFPILDTNTYNIAGLKTTREPLYLSLSWTLILVILPG